MMTRDATTVLSLCGPVKSPPPTAAPHALALNNKVKAIHPSPNVVNIYLKNTTEDRGGFKKYKSHIQKQKCTGPKKQAFEKGGQWKTIYTSFIKRASLRECNTKV